MRDLCLLSHSADANIAYLKIMQVLCKWLSEVLSELPMQSRPFLYMGCNGGMHICKAFESLNIVDDPMVGPATATILTSVFILVKPNRES